MYRHRFLNPIPPPPGPAAAPGPAPGPAGEPDPPPPSASPKWKRTKLRWTADGLDRLIEAAARHGGPFAAGLRPGGGRHAATRGVPWPDIAAGVGGGRTAEQCRVRWMKLVDAAAAGRAAAAAAAARGPPPAGSAWHADAAVAAAQAQVRQAAAASAGGARAWTAAEDEALARVVRKQVPPPGDACSRPCRGGG